MPNGHKALYALHSWMYMFHLFSLLFLQSSDVKSNDRPDLYPWNGDQPLTLSPTAMPVRIEGYLKLTLSPVAIVTANPGYSLLSPGWKAVARWCPGRLPEWVHIWPESLNEFTFDQSCFLLLDRVAGPPEFLRKVARFADGPARGPRIALAE